MDEFLRHISRIPPLDRREEIELAHRMRRGDTEARAELITTGLRFVYQRARRLGLYGSRLAEAVQAGSIGLIEAVDRFDPNRGCRLVTFSWWWIGNAMKETLPAAETCPLLLDLQDVPGETDIDLELFSELEEAQRDVMKMRYGSIRSSGHKTSRREVAKRLKMSEAQVRDMESKALSELRSGLAKVVHRAP